MTFKNFLKRVNALIHDNRTRLLEREDIEDWEEVQRKQREKEAERQKKEQEILATWFSAKNISTQIGSNVSSCALNFCSVIRVERATFRKYRNTSAKRLPVAFCPISSLTSNRSRGRESLPNGRHNKNPLKRKRARSRDLAPKQHQFVSLIVKNKSEPISIYEIVRICYVW